MFCPCVLRSVTCYSQRGSDVRRKKGTPFRRPTDPALGFLGQVVARREGPARALDDDDPHPRVGLGRVDRRDQRSTSSTGERVELRRPVRASTGRPSVSPPTAGPARPRWWAPQARASRGASTTTRASTATAPEGDAMTGLRSTSRMSGRSTPSRPSATSIEIAAAAIDRRTSSNTAQQRRATERVEHRARRGGVDRRRVGSATSSRTSAIVPPRPTRTAGPNWGSRRRPRISSMPACAIGSTSRPTTPFLRCRRRLEELERPRHRRHRRRAARGRPRRRRSCGSTRRLELERDGPTSSRPPRPRRPHRQPETPSSPRSRRARQVQALALRQGDTCRRAAPSSAVSCRTTSGPLRARATPAAMGPSASRPSCRPCQRASSAIALNASSAPRSSGAPPPSSSSTALISGGGSPEVSET